MSVHYINVRMQAPLGLTDLPTYIAACPLSIQIPDRLQTKTKVCSDQPGQTACKNVELCTCVRRRLVQQIAVNEPSQLGGLPPYYV